MNLILVDSTPSQEVYEVKDDTSSLKLVYPKQDRPTLRDIVYYHVVEKPYGKSDAPGFNDALRRFTNSHGHQYFDHELNEGLNEEIPENADIPEEYYIEEELIKVPDNKTATTENPELDLEIVYIDEMEDDENTTVSEIPADIVKDDSNDGEELKTVEHTQTRTEPELTRHTEEGVLTEKALEVKAKRTRDLLFDRVKEKYHDKNNEQNNALTVAHRRSKRGVTGRIPEAPRLKDLDLDSLPPYIRNMISVGENYFKNHEKNKDIKEIKHKMRGLFDKLDNDESGDGDESADGPSPKTYGMVLDGDGGYVWNDMWPDTGVSYEIPPPNKKPEQKPRAEGQKFNEELSETKNFEENKEDHKKNETKEEEAKEEEPENDKDYSEDEKLNEEISQSEHVQDEMPEGALRKQKKRKEKDDPMKDLIENEQFWKWLEDWTSVYMDELTKHIKKQIEEEVTKQMKNIAKPHKEDKDKKKTQEQDTDNEQNKDEPSKDKADDIKDKPVSNNDSGKPNPDNEIKNTPKDAIEKQKSETPLLEGTDNNVDGDKSNKQKDEDTKSNDEKLINNKTSPVSIKAKNIYGSSIGSDKLTNIFIFYPSKEINDIIDDLKPANLSEPGTYVFENLELQIKKENKAGNDKVDVKETPVINSEVEYSTPLIDKRINSDESTTVPTDKTPSTEKQTLEKTPNSSEIENDIPTTEKPAVNITESKLDEKGEKSVLSTTESKIEDKEQSKNVSLKENSETELGKEPISDKKEVSDSTEKDDTKKENALKDDSETEMPEKTTEKPEKPSEESKSKA